MNFNWVTKGCALAMAFCLCASMGCDLSKGNPKGGTKQYTIPVAKMCCPDKCPPRVQAALASLPWIKDVRVDYKNKQATFTAESSKYDQAAIDQVLENAGY